ncbi:hypothetical protein MTR67_041526 [Solanum verrucosum]|uniref:Uncharacterized protein n=1 Tax=Solanum verrucosum TaxID=315347 RepID=A0AAF0UMF4_SOLVR|nr:hypothetical protein MTR67_041526 [Solanum verrucosum]
MVSTHHFQPEDCEFESPRKQMGGRAIYLSSEDTMASPSSLMVKQLLKLFVLRLLLKSNVFQKSMASVSVCMYRNFCIYLTDVAEAEVHELNANPDVHAWVEGCLSCYQLFVVLVQVHPTTEDRISAGTKKKLASPVTKSSSISTPTSKPTPASKVISSSQTSVKKVNGVSYQRSSNAPVAQGNKLLSRSLISPSQSSIKKLNGSTLQRSKNSSTLENKRIAPTSLHMSLSLGPPNSTASTNTMRKSLIMERMGDKDIVKRAFKAFQSSFNQGKPEVDTRYSGSKKVLPKGSEQKISASPTPKKEVESKLVSKVRKSSSREALPDSIVDLIQQANIVNLEILGHNLF